MILLVYGDDAFRVKERSREFVEKFAEKFDPTRMNIDEFVFAKKNDVSLSRVVEAIAASPFLSAKRMVRVDGIFVQYIFQSRHHRRQVQERVGNIGERVVVCFFKIIRRLLFCLLRLQ